MTWDMERLGRGGHGVLAGADAAMMGDNMEVPVGELETGEQYNFLHQFTGIYNNSVPNYDFDDDDNPFITDNAEISECPCDNITLDCHYYTEKSFLDRFANSNRFSLLNWNICGLAAKWESVNEFISEINSKTFTFDIIAFQEIFQLHEPEIFQLPGYQKLFFRCRGNNARGGGVGIFVRDGWKVTRLDNLSIFFERVIETQFIEVELRPGHSIIIASIYRPNTHATLTDTEQLDEFLETFSNILSELNALNKTCYILTDSNIDLLKCNSHNRTQTYLNSIFDQKFLQIISKVTRSFHGSASLIDHIITNCNSSNYVSGIFINDISDHFPSFHILGDNSKKILPKYITKRNFSDDMVQRFCENIQALSWIDVFDCNNTQAAYDTFWDIFSPIFELHLPPEKIKFNRNVHKIEPWITRGLLTSRKRKYFLRDIF